MLSTHEKLKKAGLTGNEAKVYLELLKRDPIKASELAKKTSLDRTLVYQIVDNLLKKGLINYMIKDNKKYFSAADAIHLLSPLKDQEVFIKNLIVDLKKIEKTTENEFSVEVYEGKKGLMLLFEEALKYKEYCILGATGISYDIFESWEIKRIKKEVAKKTLSIRAITSSKKRGEAWTKLKGISTRFIDNIELHKATIDILGNEKVCMHLLIEQKPLFILIKNKEIASTMKAYFEVLWKISKE